ncbi:unnamed protein product [Musa acuminata subsp. malaccensis]|uniref:(wild Malaysian banana) hypothetical protein n=1 Tax=Musa acuminata subsp. malaccensis TaxID=214687 RepID=A0A8D6ZXG0_MUSAM|nr:unnamed protein product [Musa acuminata subsp. malaccensis]
MAKPHMKKPTVVDSTTGQRKDSRFRHVFLEEDKINHPTN